jgi:hypothetical protein
LQNLPKISVLNGDPLSRADLRAVKVDLCRLCVILSAKVPARVEPVLADKEVLLTALNIKVKLSRLFNYAFLFIMFCLNTYIFISYFA